jgi:hypothetical protein
VTLRPVAQNLRSFGFPLTFVRICLGWLATVGRILSSVGVVGAILSNALLMHLYNISSVKTPVLFLTARQLPKNLKFNFASRTINLLHDPLGPLDGSGCHCV